MYLLSRLGYLCGGGLLNDGPQTRPGPDTQDPQVCRLTWQKRLYRWDLVKDTEVGVDPGETPMALRALLKEREEGRVSRRCDGGSRG